ncbi:Antenna complex, alpha/beta subunit [Burkholderiales bacterium]
MIYGKMWCVVKPSVGIPMFLAAVAIGSFLVHLAITTNTTWVKRFLNGEPVRSAAVVETPGAAPAAPAAVKR